MARDYDNPFAPGSEEMADASLIKPRDVPESNVAELFAKLEA